jgi:hypothetical protein
MIRSIVNRNHARFGVLPLPLNHSMAVSGIVADYVCSMRGVTEAPPEFHAAALLSTVGALVGRRIYVNHPTPVYCNASLVLVGKTGEARKSTAMRLSHRAIYSPIAKLYGLAWPHAQVVKGVGSGEALVESVADAVTEREHGAPMKHGEAVLHIPGRRVYLVEDELTRLLRKAVQGQGSTLLENMNELSDGPETMQLRTRGAPLLATQPYFLLVGATTPGALERSFTDEMLEIGFLNRLMFVNGEPASLVPNPHEPDGALLEDVVSEICGSLEWLDLLADAWSEPCLYFSEEAESLLCSSYGPLRAYGTDENETVARVNARAQMHAVRIALLYAVMKRHAEITVGDLQAGIEWATYCAESAKALFGKFATSQLERVENRIRCYVTEHGRVSRREVQNNVRGRAVSADIFNRAWKALVEAGDFLVDGRYVSPVDEGDSAVGDVVDGAKGKGQAK